MQTAFQLMLAVDALFLSRRRIYLLWHVRAACGKDEPLLESRVGNGAGIPEALLLRGAAAFALGRRHWARAKITAAPPCLKGYAGEGRCSSFTLTHVGIKLLYPGDGTIINLQTHTHSGH